MCFNSTRLSLGPRVQQDMASVKTSNCELRARSRTHADNTFGRIPLDLGSVWSDWNPGQILHMECDKTLWDQYDLGKMGPFCHIDIFGKPCEVLLVRLRYAMITLISFAICRPHDISPHLTPIQIHINFIPTPFITRLPSEPQASKVSAAPDWAYLASPHLGTPWPKERRTNGWICLSLQSQKTVTVKLRMVTKHPLLSLIYKITPQHILWVLVMRSIWDHNNIGMFGFKISRNHQFENDGNHIWKNWTHVHLR